MSLWFQPSINDTPIACMYMCMCKLGMCVSCVCIPVRVWYLSVCIHVCFLCVCVSCVSVYFCVWNLRNTTNLFSPPQDELKHKQAHNHAQQLKVKNSGGHWTIKLVSQTAGCNKLRLPKFGFHAHTTALWPVEQSSILSTKFDCPVPHQNVSLLLHT